MTENAARMTVPILEYRRLFADSLGSGIMWGVPKLTPPGKDVLEHLRQRRAALEALVAARPWLLEPSSYPAVSYSAFCAGLDYAIPYREQFIATPGPERIIPFDQMANSGLFLGGQVNGYRITIEKGLDVAALQEEIDIIEYFDFVQPFGDAQRREALVSSDETLHLIYQYGALSVLYGYRQSMETLQALSLSGLYPGEWFAPETLSVLALNPGLEMLQRVVTPIRQLCQENQMSEAFPPSWFTPELRAILEQEWKEARDQVIQSNDTDAMASSKDFFVSMTLENKANMVLLENKLDSLHWSHEYFITQPNSEKRVSEIQGRLTALEALIPFLYDYIETHMSQERNH